MGEDAPRRVKVEDPAPNVGKIKDATIVAMLGMGWATIFNVIQFLDSEYDSFQTDDKTTVQIPIWPLTDEEKEKLAQATESAFASLPKKQHAQLAAFLNKWMPLIALTITAGTIAQPRVAYSLEAKRKRHEDAVAARNRFVQGRRAAAGSGPKDASAQSAPGAADTATSAAGSARPSDGLAADFAGDG